MKGNRLKNRGFTLIELAMVMAITAILAAVALPKYMDTGSAASETKASANRLILDQRLKANLARTVGGYPDAMTLAGGTAGTTGLAAKFYQPAMYTLSTNDGLAAVTTLGSVAPTGCSKAGLTAFMMTTSYAGSWAGWTIYTATVPADMPVTTNSGVVTVKAGSCIWYPGPISWPYAGAKLSLPIVPLETTPDVPGDIVMATGNIGFCVAKGRLVRGYTNSNGTGAMNSGSSVIKSFGPIETAAECDGAT